MPVCGFTSQSWSPEGPLTAIAMSPSATAIPVILVPGGKVNEAPAGMSAGIGGAVAVDAGAGLA